MLMAQGDDASAGVDRRCFIAAASLTAATALTTAPAAFAIGDLPETLNQTRFVQHAVVNVPDIEVRSHDIRMACCQCVVLHEALMVI
jgi:hypothetical protein